MKKDQEKRNLLVFGYGLAVILTGLNAHGIHKHGWQWQNSIFAFLAVFMLLVTIFNKSLLKAIYVRWMKVAHFIGNIVTGIIMSIIFYCVFSPLGLLFRILGKDFLDRKIDPSAQSYWNMREVGEIDRERYTKQF